MKPKVTTAITSLLPLLLLFVIAPVESYAPYGSTVVPRTKRGISEKCLDFEAISKWFELQNAAADSLKKHSDYLDEALGIKDSKNCCSHDKGLIGLLIDSVSQIEQMNGNKPRTSLTPSGDLSKDLSIIVSRIKKLVAKGFKSCCSQMEESLKKVKKDLQKQLADYKQQLKSDTGDEFSKDKKELEDKHKILRDKMKDIKEHLDKMESIKDMTESGSLSSCCTELNKKFDVLESQISAAQAEALDKVHQCESQLKDIEDMLEVQKQRTKDTKDTLDKQGVAFGNELEMCRESGGKGHKTSNETSSSCSQRMEEFVSRISELNERIVSLMSNLAMLGSEQNLYVDYQACPENDKIMDRIKALINISKNISEPNQIRHDQNDTTCLHDEELKARVNNLEYELQDLGKTANKSQTSCEKIDKLNTFAKNLINKIDQLKQGIPDDIKESKLELDELKKQLNETLSKLNKIKRNDKDFQKLKDLQAMLEKAKSDLKDLESQVHELPKPNDNDKLTDDLKKMANDSEQFWLEVDRRLTHLEGLDSNGLSDNTTNTTNTTSPGDRLMNQYNDLSQGLTKAKKDLEGLEQLKKQYNLELEKLKALENQVDNCLKACEDVPKMYALLKKVALMIKAIKDKTKPTLG